MRCFSFEVRFDLVNRRSVDGTRYDGVCDRLKTECNTKTTSLNRAINFDFQEKQGDDRRSIVLIKELLAPVLHRSLVHVKEEVKYRFNV